MSHTILLYPARPTAQQVENLARCISHASQNTLASLLGAISVPVENIRSISATKCSVEFGGGVDSLTVVEKIVEFVGVEPIITAKILKNTPGVGAAGDPGDKIFNLMDKLLESQLSALASHGQNEPVIVTLG